MRKFEQRPLNNQVPKSKDNFYKISETSNTQNQIKNGYHLFLVRNDENIRRTSYHFDIFGWLFVVLSTTSTFYDLFNFPRKTGITSKA